ncbi:MAG: AIPR family protein [Bacilli bacterium]
MDYQEFKRDFLNEIRLDASIRGTDSEDEFIDKTFSILESVDEFDSPIRHDFYKKASLRRNRVMQITGFCFNKAEKSMSMIISDFEDSYEPKTLTNTMIDELYKKMLYFLDEVCNGDISYYCDDSDETIRIAKHIKNKMNALQDSDDLILKIKFYILTNRKLSTQIKKLKESDFNEKPVEINLWHIDRFFELENSSNNEPVSIDIPKDFGIVGIPCLKGNIGENLGYEAYTAIIPGKLLADIYIEFGSKVLEGNVRAFLGTSSAKGVNNGIKRTINTDPTKFFTYNNGIATTAAQIELVEKNGQTLITKIMDLQIINGGQTTATLAETVLKKTNVDLTGIYVSMKLTVVEDRETTDTEGIRFYDDMVQKIARFANSQNKVTAADFFSNSPYHVIMEKMSKKYLAPPVNGNPSPTGWYYERARKKYEQEQIKMTKAEKDLFMRKFPKKQIITKEKLATYLFAIACKPNIVSRGKNWIMKDFGISIDAEYKINKSMFNEFYFKKSI